MDVKGTYDIFALGINFLGRNWQPKHIIVGLFEAMDTSSQVLAKDLIELLGKYNLKKKIITYVKDEGFNLNTSMTTILKSVVNCNILGLQEKFQGSCFSHAFLKTYQYATIDEFFFKGLKYVSIKTAQFDLQKYITWPKK